MKEPGPESQRLRKAVADPTLDKPILGEAARGQASRPRVALAPVSSTSGASRPSPSVAPGPRPGSAPPDASRKVARGRDHGEAVAADIIAPAREDGRHGHRKATALLRAAGWGR